MFPDETLRNKTSDNKGLKVKKVYPDIVIKNKRIKLNKEEIEQLNLDAFRYNFLEIVDGKKIFTTEIVPTLDTSCFSSFKSLFDLLGQIINE